MIANRESTKPIDGDLASTTISAGGGSYAAVATVVPSEEREFEASAFSSSHGHPFTVSTEFSTLPEARDLSWEDDFFEEEDGIVAVFDFDYDKMEKYDTSVGFCSWGMAILIPPVFGLTLLGLVPCFLKQNVKWSVRSQHVAITRDGIRFVMDRRKTCWGLPCTDEGKNSKTVPFDKITDCDILEPAGNTCFIIPNILCVVNIDTASSGEGMHELKIAGLKDPFAFKKLVWAMKRARSATDMPSSGFAITSVGPPGAMEMVNRDKDGENSSSNGVEVATLLREIRDELRQNNALLHGMRHQNDAVGSLRPTDAVETLESAVATGENQIL